MNRLALVVALFALSLAACGPKPAATPAAETPAVAPAAAETPAAAPAAAETPAAAPAAAQPAKH